MEVPRFVFPVLMMIASPWPASVWSLALDEGRLFKPWWLGGFILVALVSHVADGLYRDSEERAAKVVLGQMALVGLWLVLGLIGVGLVLTGVVELSPKGSSRRMLFAVGVVAAGLELRRLFKLR